MIGHITDRSAPHGLNRREFPEPTLGSLDVVLDVRRLPRRPRRRHGPHGCRERHTDGLRRYVC